MGVNGSKYCLCFYLFGIFVGIALFAIFNKDLESCTRKPGMTFPMDELVERGDGKTGTEQTKQSARQSAIVSSSQNVETELNQSDPLYDKVKILCWLMTSPGNVKRKVQHVKATWWGRCNVMIIVSSEEDKENKVIRLPNVIEGWNNIYSKTREAFKYSWKHYRDEADWFLKADDDAFVVLENLRLFLQDKNPQDPVWYGRVFKTFVKQGYVSGGAGYILSKEALRRYVSGLDSNTGNCNRGLGYEDVHMGQCMESIGVKSGDDRDPEGREIFHSLPIKHYTSTKLAPADGTFVNLFYPNCEGINCTTRWPVSFHHIDPENMYLLEYLLHYVQVHGRCMEYYKL